MKYLITNAADNFPCMLQYFPITYWTIIHYHMASCQLTQSIRSTVSALDLAIWLDIYMLLNWGQVKTNKWNKIIYVKSQRKGKWFVDILIYHFKMLPHVTIGLQSNSILSIWTSNWERPILRIDLSFHKQKFFKLCRFSHQGLARANIIRAVSMWWQHSIVLSFSWVTPQWLWDVQIKV